MPFVADTFIESEQGTQIGVANWLGCGIDWDGEPGERQHAALRTGAQAIAVERLDHPLDGAHKLHDPQTIARVRIGRFGR